MKPTTNKVFTITYRYWNSSSSCH